MEGSLIEKAKQFWSKAKENPTRRAHKMRLNIFTKITSQFTKFDLTFPKMNIVRLITPTWSIPVFGIRIHCLVY